MYTFVQDSCGNIVDAYHSTGGRDYKLTHLSTQQMASLRMTYGHLIADGRPLYFMADLSHLTDEYHIEICDAGGVLIEKRKEPWRGLYRNPNQAVSSSAAAIPSNPIPAGAAPPGSITVHTSHQAAAQQAAAAHALAHVNAYPSMIMAYQGYQQYAPVVQLPSHGEYGDIKRIKHEGLRPGEIVAYRCWPIKHGFLWSTAADRAWAPGEPMKAEEGHLEMGLGVFSFKEMSRVVKDFSGHSGLHGIAFGTVYLWGEIIEHEIGYRSEYASVRSIEFVKHVPAHDWNASFTDDMKKLYRVENPNEDLVTNPVWYISGEDDKAVG